MIDSVYTSTSKRKAGTILPTLDNLNNLAKLKCLYLYYHFTVVVFYKQELNSFDNVLTGKTVPISQPGI